MREPADDGTALEDQIAEENPVLERLVDELRAVRAENERLVARVETLEEAVDACQSGTEALETRSERLETRVDDLESRADGVESRTTDHRERLERVETETDRLEAITEATRNRTGANKARIEELQARELEKGAHLHAEHVDEHELDVPGGRLERITKTDGRTCVRLPASADPLEGDASTALAYGDLLPIQQLARMDEDMRRSTANALPTRLAAKLWAARTDPAVGDDPWKTGCKGIREYVTASDMKHWIRRQEPGTSDAYAKKLVSRTIDAILDLSKNRLRSASEPSARTASSTSSAD